MRDDIPAPGKGYGVVRGLGEGHSAEPFPWPPDRKEYKCHIAILSLKENGKTIEDDINMGDRLINEDGFRLYNMAFTACILGNTLKNEMVCKISYPYN